MDNLVCEEEGHPRKYLPKPCLNSQLHSYLSEVQALIKPTAITAKVIVDTRPRWLAPQQSYAKVNVDGGFARASTRGAAVARCRDDADNYLGASTYVVNDIQDPSCLEIVACCERLALAEDMNLSKLKLPWTVWLW